MDGIAEAVVHVAVSKDQVDVISGRMWHRLGIRPPVAIVPVL